MKITVLDTLTKESRIAETDKDVGFFSFGAGACDCGRMMLAFPERMKSHRCCIGPQRYVIVDTDVGADLIDLNGEYPLEIIHEFFIERGR